MYILFQSFRRNAFRYVGVLAAACILLASACKKDDPEHLCGPWEYEGEFGSEHWEHLAPVCAEYAHCDGSAQSPVNITGAVPDAVLHGLDIRYTDTQTHIIHKGHTIEFEVEDGTSALELNGTEYELKQFHFHAQSEHSINGAAQHLEAHFVHQSAGGDRAVIGVLFKDGAQNAFLAQFMNNLPNPGAVPYTSNTHFNPSGVFPTDRDYFTYPGSLTTPNCEENVTWFVLEHPVEASTAQILRFRDLMPKNYRPQAPLNGRIIRHFSN
ncbi:MAG: carbonic anhydrase family protein [Saprospiraceae bacterium]|nr:carbonic anhydrase family protein [Saprospiraceae bacterium]